MKIKLLTVLIALFVSAVSTMADNRALLVGIGNYDRMTTGWNVIHGDADVSLLEPKLRQRGFSDIVKLTNSEATKESIVKELEKLAKRSNSGDKVFFLFSGHGQPVRDDNHDEREGKKYDESIIPYDACRDNLKMGGKYYGQNHLIDDELFPLLDAIKCKLGDRGELFVVVDACYSKGIQKDEMTDIDPELLKYMRGTDHAFVPKKGANYLANLPKPKKFSKGAKMWVATACKDDERNFEYRSDAGKMYGSLSYYISILLKSNADFFQWAKAIEEGQYVSRRIFQTTQHPSVEFFE